jgi:hypothetical protein
LAASHDSNAPNVADDQSRLVAFAAIAGGAPGFGRRLPHRAFCWHARTAARALLFDHLVRAAEQRERHGDAQRLGAFQVDDQLYPGHLLDR